MGRQSCRSQLSETLSRSWHHSWCVESGCNCNTTLCMQTYAAIYVQYQTILIKLVCSFRSVWPCLYVTEGTDSTFMDIYNIAVMSFTNTTCCLGMNVMGLDVTWRFIKRLLVLRCTVNVSMWTTLVLYRNTSFVWWQRGGEHSFISAWPVWLQTPRRVGTLETLEQFRVASRLSEECDERQVSTLLYCLGEEAEEYLRLRMSRPKNGEVQRRGCEIGRILQRSEKYDFRTGQIQPP